MDIRSSFSYSLGDPPSREDADKTLRSSLAANASARLRVSGQFALRKLPSRAGEGKKYVSTSSRDKMKEWMQKL